jgi:hypothetical protein
MSPTQSYNLIYKHDEIKGGAQGSDVVIQNLIKHPAEKILLIQPLLSGEVTILKLPTRWFPLAGFRRGDGVDASLPYDIAMCQALDVETKLIEGDIRERDYQYWRRSGKERFSGSRRTCKRLSRRPQETDAGSFPQVHVGPSCLHCGHGGLRQFALLGARAGSDGS